MLLTQWNPFHEMEDPFTHFFRGAGRGVAIDPKAGWSPAVDITESAREYLVKAELSGIRKEDVKITVDNGVLMLSGERKFEKDEKDEKSHRIERFYGRFERNFSVPEDVLADRITAECKDGVLTVHLPKTDIKKARSAEIKVL